MRFHSLIWSVLALVGFALLAWGTSVVASGPFLGGDLANPNEVMVALLALILGLVVFVFGGSKLVRERVGY